ncbi:hypothetical protein F5884DRAFT_838923 [Xylogone sp. PMI_703]|nr:hypothetical protein F5884DRAFT_838923 [Xylogone sp. PMI_703]
MPEAESPSNPKIFKFYVSGSRELILPGSEFTFHYAQFYKKKDRNPPLRTSFTGLPMSGRASFIENKNYDIPLITSFILQCGFDNFYSGDGIVIEDNDAILLIDLTPICHINHIAMAFRMHFDITCSLMDDDGDATTRHILTTSYLVILMDRFWSDDSLHTRLDLDYRPENHNEWLKNIMHTATAHLKYLFKRTGKARQAG